MCVGMQRFPADKYAFFFWDHGAGWPGFGVRPFIPFTPSHMPLQSTVASVSALGVPPRVSLSMGS